MTSETIHVPMKVITSHHVAFQGIKAQDSIINRDVSLQELNVTCTPSDEKVRRIKEHISDSN